MAFRLDHLLAHPGHVPQQEKLRRPCRVTHSASPREGISEKAWGVCTITGRTCGGCRLSHRLAVHSFSVRLPGRDFGTFVWLPQQRPATLDLPSSVASA